MWGRVPARLLVMQIFCVKESISREMNNDNDLNLHLHDQIGLASTANKMT
jgi:hypothetical protein